MSFLSFQEFLKYFSMELSMLQQKEQLEQYLPQYMEFCTKHHMLPNLFDLHKELAPMQV